jgi:hypothetical protein
MRKNAKIFKNYKNNQKFFGYLGFFLGMGMVVFGCLDIVLGMGMAIFGYLGLNLILGNYRKPNSNPSVCLGTYV